jgi:hypothetical protein
VNNQLRFAEAKINNNDEITVILIKPTTPRRLRGCIGRYGRQQL